MQRLTLTIAADLMQPGDGFRLFGNVDRAGRPLAAIDYDRQLNGSIPQPFHTVPGGSGAGGFLETPFLTGEHLGAGAPAAGTTQAETPPLFFGWYSFAVVTVDPLGNPSADQPQTFRAFVNSGPVAPTRLRQSGVENGRPVLAFEGAEQLT